MNENIYSLKFTTIIKENSVYHNFKSMDERCWLGGRGRGIMTSQAKINRPRPLPPNQHRAPTHAPPPRLARHPNAWVDPTSTIPIGTTRYCCYINWDFKIFNNSNYYVEILIFAKLNPI